MANATLFEPIFDGGLRSIKFFNGRLLSGEDLTKQQDADKETFRRIVRGLGDGVARGLRCDVRVRGGGGSVPGLKIYAGLAFAKNGDVVHLPEDTDIDLTLPSAAAPSGSSTTFNVCIPPQTGTYVPGAAVYLLTIARAEGSEGKAPVLGVSSGDHPCNARYRVEGPVFRVHQIDVPGSDLASTARPKLRSRLAQRAFASLRTADQIVTATLLGSASAPTPAVQPLSFSPAVADDEVPIALLFLTAANGIEFIDHWSVRRRPCGPSNANEPASPWAELVSDPMRAAREAMFLQFQDQVANINSVANAAGSTKAKDTFAYLPPAGVLPMRSLPQVDGFDQARFFEGIRSWKPVNQAPLHLEGARLTALLRASLDYPPISLDGEEAIWVYVIRENRRAVDATPPTAPPYLVFAHGQMPPFAEARFDVARWGYANFG